MEIKSDNAGVKVPPPLFYVAGFLVSIVLQMVVPISKSFFETTAASLIGWVLIGVSFLLGLPAVIQFFRFKTAIVPIKPVTALQTTGIYSFTRNPMYFGMLLFYTGLAFLTGNWWTFILIPGVVMIIYQTRRKIPGAGIRAKLR